MRLCAIWVLLLGGGGMANVSRIADCDLTGKALSSKNVPAVEDCQKLCDNMAQCEAYTYVSGWGRCVLRTEKGRQHRIRIASGIVVERQGQRAMEAAGFGWDNSGKDLRQDAAAKDLASCETSCLQETTCKAYAFIDGYHLCWLKKAQGRKRQKVFYCGIKTD